MMRNKFKLFCVTAAIASCMSIPAFAAETKEDSTNLKPPLSLLI